MFGAKTALKRKRIQQLTTDMIALGNDQIKTTDQALLEKIFWPTVKDDAVITFTWIYLRILLIFIHVGHSRQLLLRNALVTGKGGANFAVPHEKIEFFVCFGPAER
jgi:hypothetical protein